MTGRTPPPPLCRFSHALLGIVAAPPRHVSDKAGACLLVPPRGDDDGVRGGGYSRIFRYALPFGDLVSPYCSTVFFSVRRGGPAAIFQVLSRRLSVAPRASFQACGHSLTFAPPTCGISRPMPISLVGDPPRTAARRATRRRGAPEPRSARARRTGDLWALPPPSPAGPPGAGGAPAGTAAHIRRGGTTCRNPCGRAQNNGRGRQGTGAGCAPGAGPWGRQPGLRPCAARRPATASPFARPAGLEPRRDAQRVDQAVGVPRAQDCHLLVAPLEKVEGVVQVAPRVV